jgi:hypothetical protein
MEENRICPHCKIVNVDEDHINDCPSLTAPTVISDNESQLGPPEKLNRIAVFTKKYTEATALEKEQLWVCRSCYHFGEAEITPVVCIHCGVAFTASAIEFMEKLGR